MVAKFCWKCSAGSEVNPTDDDLPCGQHAQGQSSAKLAHKVQHSHEYETLVYLFGALVLGGFVLHVTMIPALKSLQTTVVIFASGVLLGLVMESGALDDVQMVKRSYDSWTNIDPHLLLYTFLPPLLCGDAMTIDTHVARRCMYQCLWLAGPGVLVGSFSTALAVSLVYGWDFWLSLTVGSILAATDPVAVVTLLKDLGASPQLTIMIQGESLLNDGTAIVLFTVAYDIVCGEEYGVRKVIFTVCKSIIGALVIGVAVGLLAYGWIYKASDKLHHHSCMVQVAVSLSCAYWSFILSEGVFHASGVLSTVATSLVLAHKMWPVLVSGEGMLQIWHMIEMVGNTLVFFLSGTITGKTLRVVEFGDYFRAVAIYLIVSFIRALMLTVSYPVLNYAGHPVAVRDILVMSWGGLRGMVGMALAILVKKDGLANGHISAERGDRILFLINTMAMLTLVINAPTCPAFCRKLGIMRTPEGRNVLLRNVARHAESGVLKSMNNLLNNPRASKLYAPRIMRGMVEFVLDEVKKHLPSCAMAMSMAQRAPVSKSSSFASDISRGVAVRCEASQLFMDVMPTAGEGTLVSAGATLNQCKDKPKRNSHKKVQRSGSAASFHELSQSIVHSVRKSLVLEEAEAPDIEQLWTRFEQGKQSLLNSGAKITQFQFGKQLPVIRHILRTQSIDPSQLKVVREVFLEAVRANYWELLESGWLIAGSSEPSALIRSVDLAQEKSGSRLEDWYILEKDFSFLAEDQVSKAMSSMTMLLDPDSLSVRCHSCLKRMRAKRIISRQTHAVHVIEAFIEAHCRAQTQVASYFGLDREVDSPEEAFVVIESQIEVFAAAAKRILIDKRLAVRVSTMWEVQQLFKRYHKYVYHVNDVGVLTQKEAEILLHPLEDGMRKLHQRRQTHFKALDTRGDDELNLLHLVCGKHGSRQAAAARIQRVFRRYKAARALAETPQNDLEQRVLYRLKTGGWDTSPVDVNLNQPESLCSESGDLTPEDFEAREIEEVLR